MRHYIHSPFMILTGIFLCAFLLKADTLHASQKVRIEGQQLTVDFDQDGNREPFVIKSVTYAPVPIGKFNKFSVPGDEWSALCTYTGDISLVPEDELFNSAPPEDFSCNEPLDNFFNDTAILDRDFPLMKTMNANTVRTLTKVTHSLMDKAEEHGLKVLAGYWVNDIDFIHEWNQAQINQSSLVQDYLAYVEEFKDKPALLMWEFANENNLGFCANIPGSCDQQAQAEAYYQLVNHISQKVRFLEDPAQGINYHPFSLITAGIDPHMKDYAHLMPNVDIHGTQAFFGMNFDLYEQTSPGVWEKYSTLFDEFSLHFPGKPMYIAGFGVDAWNSCAHLTEQECINNATTLDASQGSEDQETQAAYILSAWQNLTVNLTMNGGPANGGSIDLFADIWNKYPNAWSIWYTPSIAHHDHGYTDPNHFGFGVMPDHHENPEWWGIMSIAKNPNPDEIDILTPRQVYFDLQEAFKDRPLCWNSVSQCAGDANTDGTINFIDLGILKSAFFKSYGDPDYQPCTDFNKDGVSNFLDLGVLKAHMFTSPDSCEIGGAWPPSGE